MYFWNCSFATPTENLAADEALLEACEAGEIACDANSESGVVLRFWESPRHFVALGYAGKLAEEVNERACRAHNIPVLRRCSGGGTVLQGPGCLNYAVIAKIPTGDALAGITDTNIAVMRRQARALSHLLSTPVAAQGHTDLTIGDKKISGNAQRRKACHFLFHGTFLLDFDVSLLEKFLRLPRVQPEYRAHRPHDEFVTNLPVSAEAVKTALMQEWNATQVLPVPPIERIRTLVREKYLRDEWNQKF